MSVDIFSSYIAGKTIAGETTFSIRSPASGKQLADVVGATVADVDRATAVAKAAFAAHRNTPLATRSRWCRKASDLLASKARYLAQELAEEQGKPLIEANAEVDAAVRGLRLAAEEAERLGGEVIPVLDPDKHVYTIRQPLGPWALLTPWNFPLNIPLEYLGPAIATASPIVWKPAPSTSRIAARLHALLLYAGVPADLLQLVLSDDVTVAERLVTRPEIVAVGLTGSSTTGEAVARAAWDKHLLLELGGNGPIVVLDDADLDIAAPAIASAAFTNAGQVCSAAGRVLASRQIADELAARLATLANEIVVGSSLDTDSTMGPVHTAQVAATMSEHLKDAIAGGARVLAGGSRIEGHPTDLFWAPTVITDVSVGRLIEREETFGPVAAIVPLADDDALLSAANGGDSGLVAAVFTTSLRRAHRFARDLQTGSVVINDTSNYWELHLPFGGRAGSISGRGRVGGKHALQQFTELKTISVDLR